jgi:hypothetical protein
VEALTALPQAGGLRCLDVSGEHCGIQPVEVQRLLETPHMGQLTTLVLRYDTVPSDGREAFWEEFPVCEFRR